MATEKDFFNVPETLEGLFGGVANDMIEINADRRFEFNMNTWAHSHNGYCTVCAAGAWLSRKIITSPINKNMTAQEIEKNAFIIMGREPRIRKLMYFIDDFREEKLVDLEFEEVIEEEYSHMNLLDSYEYENLLIELANCYPVHYDSRSYQDVLELFIRISNVFRKYKL